MSNSPGTRRTTVLQHQDRVNLCALGISAALALYWPLQTFLIAYAFVGPFHYLTEIAWLRKKQYYYGEGVVSPRWFVAATTALCVVASLDLYYRKGWTAYIVALLLVLSLGSLVTNRWVLAGALVLVGATRFLVHGYGLFLAAFVPTVVHVYVFTLLFLLSGVMRAKRANWLGWVNPALLLALPMLLVKLPALPSLPGHYWMISEAPFASTHRYIAEFLGLGMHFDPGRPLDAGTTAIFRFLAFIYLHHYLNWFAKTELLEWHKLSRPAWGAIAAIYAASISMYWYSFTVGFYAVYFLSLLHVLLELPLDWRAASALVTVPIRQWRAGQAPAS